MRSQKTNFSELTEILFLNTELKDRTRETSKIGVFSLTVSRSETVGIKLGIKEQVLDS